MRLLALLVAGLLAGVVVAAPVPKAVKRTAPSLDGTWQVAEWYSNGRRMQLGDTIRWAIDGETLAVEGANPAGAGGFILDATRTIRRPDGGEANALDYTIRNADGTEHSVRAAVFELDGDTLKICLGADRNSRPAGCEPANGPVMYVLKRVTDK